MNPQDPRPSTTRPASDRLDGPPIDPAARVHASHGDLSLVLAPALGGAIAVLQYRGVDVLVPMAADCVQCASLAGSFPLVPYSNRIADGRFRFDGQDHALALNFGEHPHPLHGNGWQSAWHVASQQHERVVLALEHDARGEGRQHWPWPYAARQEFVLAEDGLSVTLRCTNLATQDMPVGLGFHPNFARADQALLRFHAQQVLLNDERTLPLATQAVPAAWDYRTWRNPPPGSVDNCFIGWDGSAHIAWPQAGIQVEIGSPDARHAVCYVSPAEKNFIAFEPVTNINNAINDLPIDGGPGAMQRLRPGATVSTVMTLKMRPCVRRPVP